MDKITDIIKSEAKDNKIACKKALAIAEKNNVSPAEVGKKLNELKIKIVGCQLGCFK